ncbi:MAG: UDP-N-acetylmuramate dehydrogenase [Bdellovibrionales bacterium]
MSFHPQIRRNVPLKDWTWWKIGGPADHFCLPSSVEEVLAAVRFAQDKELPLTILGGGTNVLVSDAGIEGLVICMRELKHVESEERDGRLQLTALAGTPKSELTKIFLRRKLAPALFLCGLPGDVGGGVVMNAGVSESVVPREFVEIVDWVDVLPLKTLQIERKLKSDLRWTYRACTGWQPGILVRVGVSWELKVIDEIPRAVKEATRNRLRRQPLELPSCGSTFKNPEGAKAGALIEQAGLKGYQVGGAQVSEKHANFIVNRGGARAQDVHAIIFHIQQTVKNLYGFTLEPEVKFIGRGTDNLR